MGCAISCFRAPDDGGEPTTATVGHGICLRCFTLSQQFGAILFQRREVNNASSFVQRTTSPSCTVTEDSSISDTYRAPPRPLPYDDPRCSNLRCQHEHVVSVGDKASSHFHEESDPIQDRNIDNDCAGSAGNYDSEGQSKVYLPQSSLKFASKYDSSGVKCIFLSSEEEDACPICLEEYNSENPKITLQCVHSFHLSCIYEWMERSEACPVCAKVMLFDDTTLVDSVPN